MVENPDAKMTCAREGCTPTLTMYDVTSLYRQRLGHSPRWPTGTLAGSGVDSRLYLVLSVLPSYLIPNLGFISPVASNLCGAAHIRLQRALLVAAGLILTNLCRLCPKPDFMKKGVDVSFVEITLSLVFGVLCSPCRCNPWNPTDHGTEKI